VDNFESSNPARDWPEDAEHENGQYFCACSVCKETFIGYKRRRLCKLCSAKEAPIMQTCNMDERTNEEKLRDRIASLEAELKDREADLEEAQLKLDHAAEYIALCDKEIKRLKQKSLDGVML